MVWAKEQSDDDLLQRVVAGDESAFVLIYRRWPEEQAPGKDSPRNTKVNPTSQSVGPEYLDSELASAFVPLPFGEDPMLPEDEVVVRVSLPPAAFASFGVPVSDAGRDKNVLADVIVGEDGTPQAVGVVDERYDAY
jgi:hypothetical protein